MLAEGSAIPLECARSRNLEGQRGGFSPRRRAWRLNESLEYTDFCGMARDPQTTMAGTVNPQAPSFLTAPERFLAHSASGCTTD
jgi:hypothetical protein